MGKLTFLNPEFSIFLDSIGRYLAFIKRNQQVATLKISSIKGFEGNSSLLVRFKPYLSIEITCFKLTLFC
jgi:Ca-activated chloride channel family protein